MWLQLLRFPEAIEGTLEDLMPNRLTDYLYNLSDIYNGFYTDCQVIAGLCTAPLCDVADA